MNIKQGIEFPEIDDTTSKEEAMEKVFGLMNSVIGTNDDFGKFIKGIYEDVKERNQKDKEQ
jgi:hypothetical protein